MRRRRGLALAATALLWLALGAAINVGMAWGFACVFWRWYEGVALGTVSQWIAAEHLEVRAIPIWPVQAPEHWPEAPTEAIAIRGFGWDYTTTHASDETCYARRMAESRYGLPCRSLAGITLDEASMNLTGPYDEWFSWNSPAIDRLLTSGACRVLLPLRPLWPGFAINTLFYAASAWLVWRIVPLTKRWRRRRAGRCTNCGYDLRGIAAGSICPECGVQSGAAKRRPPSGQGEARGPAAANPRVNAPPESQAL